MKQKIALLYLKTGGGHISGTKAISKVLSENYSNSAEAFLYDGFKGRMWFNRFFFETGYSVSSNYLELFYVLFYQLSQIPFVIKIAKKIFSPHIVLNLTRFLKKENITKVVVLHSILITMARDAIDNLDNQIPLITIVMDPFTAHYGWFFEKKTNLIVFSQKLRKEAINKYGFSPSQVYLFPFMLSSEFERLYSDVEKAQIREKLLLSKDQKIVLITGGGEGLKGAEKLILSFLRKKLPHTVIVVCGKNILLKRTLTFLKQKFQAKNLVIYGYVSFMPDLMNIADCVITKGGPATVMEVLSVKKPVILSSYVRGQELGNMLFVVVNKVGWYLKNPDEIIEKANQVLYDPELNSSIKSRIAELNVKSGLRDIVHFIHEYKEI